jgi:hypothetical protein
VKKPASSSQLPSEDHLRPTAAASGRTARARSAMNRTVSRVTCRVLARCWRAAAASAEKVPAPVGLFMRDVNYTWDRLVMRRGTVSREVDTSLSPHIGVVEDPSRP